MTDKELKSLGRRELLEMLLAQTKELNQVKKELQDAHDALNDRRILLSQSGSIAEAALKLNQVFEAAQKAADQYLESIRHSDQDWLEAALSEETGSEERQRLLEQTRQECDAMREKTEKECAYLRMAAQRECQQILEKARKNS